jgi:hypothetical protein
MVNGVNSSNIGRLNVSLCETLKKMTVFIELVNLGFEYTDKLN